MQLETGASLGSDLPLTLCIQGNNGKAINDNKPSFLFMTQRKTDQTLHYAVSDQDHHLYYRIFNYFKTKIY